MSKEIRPDTSRIATVDIEVMLSTEGEVAPPFTIKNGDPLHVKAIDAGMEIAVVHLGGELYAQMTFEALRQATREADVDELKKTLRHCQRCDKIELQPGKWLPKPPCFTPRPGVTMVPHNCPACDK